MLLIIHQVFMFHLLYLSIFTFYVYFIKNINITFVEFLAGYELGPKNQTLILYMIIILPWNISYAMVLKLEA